MMNDAEYCVIKIHPTAPQQFVGALNSLGTVPNLSPLAKANNPITAKGKR